MNIKDLISDKVKSLTYYDSYVTVCGDSEVLIENISNVYDCNEIMARVKAGRKEIVIWGNGLKMKNYVTSSCIVKGKITSVEIISGGAVKE